jgi:hypothetical protein
MTVADLIEILRGYPQTLPVAYYLYSEQCLLEAKDISIQEYSVVREDGWIQNKRPDMATQLYLMFPGN